MTRRPLLSGLEPEDLEEALAEIADDLRHQYVLGFSTGDGAVRYRDLEVEVAGRTTAPSCSGGATRERPPRSSAGG